MTMFDTIRQAEKLATEHGDTALANGLYALGCELGRRTIVPKRRFSWLRRIVQSRNA